MFFERPQIIRPPHEDGSYYLPLTAGCSNSFCGFCNYFYGKRLKIRELNEVKQEIDALALFQKERRRMPGMPQIVYDIAGVWNGRGLFLQDGDALVYPYPQLLEALDYLNRRLPGVERISCFATAQDVLLRSVDELKALKDRKLKIIYMGVESGDDGILQYVGKAITAREIVEAGQRIKAAGIELSVTIILGLGGREKSQAHALATARILSDLNPDSADALTLTLVPGTPMYESHQRGEFNLISPFQSLQELKTIIENSSFTSCLFRSIHASNYLSLSGNLPEYKAEMLSRLEHILSSLDSSLLKPEYLRGL
jgi:radical SAM superfamily enzyme YgiQ (UPF0313 family)